MFPSIISPKHSQALKKKIGTSSRNLMSEELLRKSSLFRRDMRKLNMMKEVKDILENKQRMEGLSTHKQNHEENQHEQPF